MRPVDADAFKDSIREWQYHGFYDKLIEVIDNAPTVPLPDFKEGYKQAIIDGKTNFSRPQGEWIIEHLPKNINDLNDCYECVSCSECGFHYDYMFHNSNYCPNCGANMRGE